ncbi:MAG: hypothetical protein NTX57_21055 [Armatimonadetes bacterium]|nr:hypothetical protein [Armatimonadota bacterium]
MEPEQMFLGIAVIIGCHSGMKAILHHRLKMAEIKAKSVQANDVGVQVAIDELRNEVRQLRDTTMRYDMSFDAALTRMEERVDRMETRSSYTTTANDPLARLRTEQ